LIGARLPLMLEMQVVLLEMLNLIGARVPRLVLPYSLPTHRQQRHFHADEPALPPEHAEIPAPAACERALQKVIV
jgi:hypothetical protein